MTSETVVVGPSDGTAAARLQSVEPADQEMLRRWRNANRAAFLETAEVDPVGQSRWFAGYLCRDDDFLFLVMAGDAAVGCVGVRLRGPGWDVYNVIRGVRTPASRGCMGRGLALAVAFALGRRDLPVTAVVLAENPAVGWYLRQGFAIVERRPQTVLLRWAGAAGQA